jgi:uncharacterized membrane protein (DUF4010 family)
LQALPPLELAGRLALAVGLAVFMGLAFEEVYKTEERSIPGGIRTFPMLAMCGAALTLIEPAHGIAFVAGLLGVAAWMHAYLRAAPAAKDTPTFMVPVSNLLAFILGPIALSQPPWVAVALAVAAVLLLGAREKLHRLIHVIPRGEVITAGMFLILVGIILPLVPHEPVSRLTPLTPYGIWLAVVTVCTVSYLSYLLQRYAPFKDAALLPAVLGGAYSSTATTVVLAKRLRDAKQAPADISAGIVVATAIMYVRIDLVIAVFDRRFALILAPGLLALAAIGAALALYEWRRPRPRAAKSNLVLAPKNPLQIPTALVFAVLIVVISIVSDWVKGTFGASGILVLSAVVGFTDIDPFVLNIAQGGIGGMPVASLCAAVLIAASSNNVAKAAYAISFGGMDHARRPAIMLLALALLGLAVAATYAVYV